jgi:hypothetical protein
MPLSGGMNGDHADEEDQPMKAMSQAEKMNTTSLSRRTALAGLAGAVSALPATALGLKIPEHVCTQEELAAL